jgi:hypothetical protein
VSIIPPTRNHGAPEHELWLHAPDVADDGGSTPAPHWEGKFANTLPVAFPGRASDTVVKANSAPLSVEPAPDPSISEGNPPSEDTPRPSGMRRIVQPLDGWLICLDPREEARRCEQRIASPESFGAYRKQIEHEDDLIGVRNGWLIGGEAFLFAAFAALLALPQDASPQFKIVAHVLLWELPVIGVVMALLVFCSVSAALVRSEQLRREFEGHYRVPEGFPAVMSRKPRRAGHSVARLVPLCLAVSWVVAFVVEVVVRNRPT